MKTREINEEIVKIVNECNKEMERKLNLLVTRIIADSLNEAFKEDKQ